MKDTLSPEERSIRMSLVRSKDTKPEMRVRRLVHAMGYRYRLHVSDLPGHPDMVFPSRRKIIFVHGCFWHQHNCAMGARMPKSKIGFWKKKLEGNKKRDSEIMQRLKKDHWSVLVIWECQIKKTEALKARVKKFLQETIP
ncbi:MAG: DNA mismatch endonuclease Vsr [Nitrospiraceae bacterium]|nr:DNA mismatch endonuclease Vsr [Nitrospiraceae bacterium]